MDDRLANPSERLKPFFGFSSGFLEAAMSRESTEIYEFAGYRLDVDERTFHRLDGVKNGSLPEKPFQTLTVLVRNHGRLVTKQELLDAVWPDSFVEENNLDKCIHAIRHALGEKPGQHKYIETVRKHGYRFVADVEKITENGHASANENEVPQPAPKVTQTLGPRSASFVAGVAILAIISATTYFVFLGPRSNAKKPSIAVLPLRPVMAGMRDDLIELGVADSLIHQLSSGKGLIVRPLDSVRHYADLPVDSLAVGTEQKTDYVLASNYQLLDGKVKITSQLIKVSTGEIADTYQIEKAASDVFATQNSLAVEFGNRILSAVGVNAGRDLAAGRGTQNEEAYRSYLTGYNLLSRRAGNAGSRQAIEHFKRALELDPNYAKAWASLARAYVSFPVIPKEESLQAQEAIDRALAIDNDLADAYDARATLRLYFYRDYHGAESDALRAKSLSPEVGAFCGSYSAVLWLTGRVNDAVEEAKRAIDLDPRSFERHRNLGIALYHARRYPDAIEQLNRVVSMDPNFDATYFWLMQSYQMNVQYDKAYETYITHIFTPGMNTPENIARFRNAYATGGWRALSQARLEAWKHLDRIGKANHYHMAFLAAELGLRDEAFEHLNWLAENHEQQIVRIKVDPQMDPLRSDPRFNELLKRVGF
jgi:DNA-binding winged helix-turn-helix (wHTH) protein/TolB-like protein/tetratricopeptide (TPR) repeat protein